MREPRSGTERSWLRRHGCLLLLACMLPIALGTAQSSGGPYVMRKFAIAGGGTEGSAPGLRVVATVGQIAVVQVGGQYRLTGGFHKPANAPSDRLFCDGFETTPCVL
jgi:hypothetical protein